MFESLRKLFLPNPSSSWRMVRVWIGDRREAIGLSLLRLAAIAHRERLDLAPLVRNLSLEHRGSSRRRLNSLATRLNAGSTLVDALEQSQELLSDEQVLDCGLHARRAHCRRPTTSWSKSIQPRVLFSR